jgi:hypothetical protein
MENRERMLGPGDLARVLEPSVKTDRVAADREDTLAVGQCRACGKPVSTIPLVCPHCGARKPTDPTEATAMSAGAAPEGTTPPPLAQPSGVPTSVLSAAQTTVSDRVATPEWSAPAPSRMALSPAQGLLILGIPLVVGILWYGYSAHGKLTTPSAQGVVARAPVEAQGTVSAPVTPSSSASGRATSLPDATKFEASYRAGKALEKALAIGVSYKDFDGLLQAFSTELLTTKDRVISPPEQTLLEGYTEVLTTYQDSRVLWKEQDDQALKYGWANTPERNPAGLIVVEGDVLRIVQRYGLPTRQDPNGTVIAGTSIQFLWAKAATQFAAASATASLR